jgi:hypothetical protein
LDWTLIVAISNAGRYSFFLLGRVRVRAATHLKDQERQAIFAAGATKSRIAGMCSSLCGKLANMALPRK